MVTEYIADAQDNGKPLFMLALDVRKAFDTVDHNSLLRKLFNYGVKSNLWTVISENLNYNAKVKLSGDLGISFNINQGVDQGKVLSSHCCTAYINGLIDQLSESCEGLYIGEICFGNIFCAVDALLLASSSLILQTQVILLKTMPVVNVTKFIQVNVKPSRLDVNHLMK